MIESAVSNLPLHVNVPRRAPRCRSRTPPRQRKLSSFDRLDSIRFGRFGSVPNLGSRVRNSQATLAVSSSLEPHRTVLVICERSLHVQMPITLGDYVPLMSDGFDDQNTKSVTKADLSYCFMIPDHCFTSKVQVTSSANGESTSRQNAGCCEPGAWRFPIIDATRDYRGGRRSARSRCWSIRGVGGCGRCERSR